MALHVFAIIPDDVSFGMYVLRMFLCCGVAFSPLILYIGWRVWFEVIQPDTDERRRQTEHLRSATLGLADADDPSARRQAIQRMLVGGAVYWLRWLEEICVAEQLAGVMLAAGRDSEAGAAWDRLARAYGIPPVRIEVQEADAWQSPSPRVALEVIRMAVLSTYDLLPGTPFVARLDVSKIEELVRADHPSAMALRYRPGDQDWQTHRWTIREDEAN